jgi:GxxExxY protein
LRNKSKPESAEEAETRDVPQVSWSAENELTDKIIGAAIEVHRHLGPGLLEAVYEECLCYELSQTGLKFQRQVHLPINYKGIKFESAYKMDLVVEDAIVVEIKAIEEILPVHAAQLLTYLKSANKRVGLLINFNVPILRNGLKRIVNHYVGASLAPRVSASSALEPGEEKMPDSLSSSPRLSPRLRVSASNREPASKNEPASNDAPAENRRPH